MKFKLNYENFLSAKWIWNCHLKNVGHIFKASLISVCIILSFSRLLQKHFSNIPVLPVSGCTCHWEAHQSTWGCKIWTRYSSCWIPVAVATWLGPRWGISMPPCSLVLSISNMWRQPLPGSVGARPTALSPRIDLLRWAVSDQSICYLNT